VAAARAEESTADLAAEGKLDRSFVVRDVAHPKRQFHENLSSTVLSTRAQVKRGVSQPEISRKGQGR
jgi:hypothetical protein